MKVDIYKEFLRGEPGGLSPIFMALRGVLIKYGCKYVSRVDAAEDAVSEAFLELWLHIGKFERGEHIRNFLYLTVWNKCQNELRTLQRFTILPEDAKDLSDLSALEIKDILESDLYIPLIVDKINEKLQQLPKRRKQDFYTHYFESTSFEEIARERGVSVATVRQNVEYAREKIEKYLEKVEFFFSQNITF